MSVLPETVRRCLMPTNPKLGFRERVLYLLTHLGTQVGFRFGSSAKAPMPGFSPCISDGTVAAPSLSLRASVRHTAVFTSVKDPARWTCKVALIQKLILPLDMELRQGRLRRPLPFGSRSGETCDTDLRIAASIR